MLTPIEWCNTGSSGESSGAIVYLVISYNQPIYFLIGLLAGLCTRRPAGRACVGYFLVVLQST